MRDDKVPPSLGKATEAYDKLFFWNSYRDLEVYLNLLRSKGPITVSTLTADSLAIVGDVTVGGNVTITGDLTVDDITADQITANHVASTTAAFSTSATIASGAYSSYNGTPISTLTGGSTFGALIEGASSGHLVLGIRDNDVNDSVSIVSYNGTGAYSHLVMGAKASGLINIFGQIGFPATPNLSSGANVMDDYEEGSFSPILSAETTPPTSVTYDASNYGRYVKIGRNVWIVGRMRTSAVTVGAMAGVVIVGGLPFASSSSHASIGSSVDVGFRTGWVTQGPERGLVFGTGTSFRLYYDNSATGSVTLLPANISATVNDVAFGGWYITDS